MRIPRAASLLVLTLWLPCAYGADNSAGVTLPGLRSDPAGSVTVSAASLVSQAGNIELTLTVTVQRNQGGSVTIQMPRFGWLGEAEPYPDRQFPELQILADARPAKTESSFEAYVGSADVTEAILRAAVDPFSIAETPPFVTPRAGGAQAIEALERLGAVEKSDGEYLAKWTVQRRVEVALDAGSHTLTLSYKGRPGFSLLRFDQISKPAYLAKYCLSAANLTSVFGRVVATRMFVVSDYAVPSSVDDRPPRSLSVALAASRKEAAQRTLIAFCGADGKAVIGQIPGVTASARTDAKGTIHILSIASVSGSR